MTLATTQTALGDIALLRATGRVDGKGARFQRALAEALTARPQALIVDAHELRVGLPGARVLLEATALGRTQGCRVVVCRMNDDDLRCLASLADGGRTVRVYPSLEEATEGLLLDSAWI